MELLAEERRANCSRGLKKARQGEVIGMNRVRAHVQEVVEGSGKMTVLNMTGDEGGPGDDRTNVDRRMEKDKVGRDGTV